MTAGERARARTLITAADSGQRVKVTSDNEALAVFLCLPDSLKLMAVQYVLNLLFHRAKSKESKS